MRTEPSLLVASVFAVLALSSCSRHREARQPGGVTLRFVNATKGDVFVDATYGEQFQVTTVDSGSSLSRGTFCTTTCDPEGCKRRISCGSPLFIVRSVPAGGIFTTEWLGDFWEPGRCSDGYGCQTERWAADGTYVVTMTGRTAAKSLAAQVGDDPRVHAGLLDESSASCTATGHVTLASARTSTDLTWTCAK
jgi:hypothetical protein